MKWLEFATDLKRWSLVANRTLDRRRRRRNPPSPSREVARDAQPNKDGTKVWLLMMIVIKASGSARHTAEAGNTPGRNKADEDI